MTRREKQCIVMTINHSIVGLVVPNIAVCEACGWEGPTWEIDQSTWPGGCPSCKTRNVRVCRPGPEDGDVEALREELLENEDDGGYARLARGRPVFGRSAVEETLECSC